MIETDTDNRTALWHAVCECNVTAVEILLRSGGDALAVDQEGVTLLNYAILRDNTWITRLILEHLTTCFPTTTFLDKKDVNGAELPLSLSAQLARTRMIEILLEFGADVNAVDRHEQTPLHQAVHKGHFGAVELFLSQQGIDLQAQNDYGSTALHIAVKQNHSSIVDLLLAHPHIDINCQDNNGNTPLWWSTRLEHNNISSQLLAINGVDLNAIGQKSGLYTTALYHAVERGNYLVAKQLVKQPELNLNILGSFR
jgi:ankyrin repeat protein